MAVGIVRAADCSDDCRGWRKSGTLAEGQDKTAGRKDRRSQAVPGVIGSYQGAGSKSGYLGAGGKGGATTVLAAGSVSVPCALLISTFRQIRSEAARATGFCATAGTHLHFLTAPDGGKTGAVTRQKRRNIAAKPAPLRRDRPGRGRSSTAGS